MKTRNFLLECGFMAVGFIKVPALMSVTTCLKLWKTRIKLVRISLSLWILGSLI